MKVPPANDISWADLDGKLAALEVVCRTCGRAGRYSVARRIAEFGRDASVYDFLATVKAGRGCSGKGSSLMWEGCVVYAPDLYRYRRALPYRADRKMET